jgi:hypothetical protein
LLVAALAICDPPMTPGNVKPVVVRNLLRFTVDPFFKTVIYEVRCELW